MAGSIKGIILEIGGDTSGLQNALKKVNSSTSSLSKELRGVNTLLKLNPKNTELLSQKQTILNDKMAETEKKLEILKKAKEDADEAMASGTEISAENYRNLEREIINTEYQLKQLKAEASNWTVVGKNIQNVGQKVESVGSKIGNLGMTLTKTVTTSMAAITGLAIKTFNEVDEGADNVIKKTGATGKAAKELEDIYKKVAGNVVGSFEDVGNAVGEINTRFEITGDTLQKTSEDFLKFAKINNVDVNEAVQKVSRYMGDASIKSSEYKEVLDTLTSAAQTSGISINSLTEMLTKYGAPMRALGLDTKESIAIFAGWEKAGVNTEIAFSGMKKAISNWGKAGKDSSKEFKKTLEEIEKAPNIAEATTKAIEVFGAKAGPDLADAIKGGRFEYEKFLNVLKKSDGVLENTYNNITDETDKAEVSMKKLKVEFAEVGKEILSSAYPAVENILGSIKDLIKKFNNLDPKMKENIIRYGAMATAMGPALKIGGNLITTTGKGITSIGKLCVEVAKAKNGLEVASGATGLLAKGISGLLTPAGLAATGITAAVGLIVVAMEQTERATKDAFSNMGNSATDFINGIDTAQSHLDAFNSELFVSSEEQQKLQKQMDEVQKGITSICKTAADERRGYTQEEIKQLDEYFTKLRELNQREIEIQGKIAEAITQQAEQNAKTFQGTLEEYKVQSQEWLKTAEEQKDKTIALINNQTIEEVALLNTRYATEEARQTEAYQKEYERIIAQKEEKIAQANDEVGKINQTYANGYLERSKADDGFYKTLQESVQKQEKLQQDHNDKIEKLKNNELWYVTDTAGAIRSENETFAFHQKEFWNEMYKNMSDEQEKELGVWLAMVSQTELYGGEIDKETQRIVDGILASYESMPDSTRETMKNTMSPMLEEMKNSEPTLFAKATGIANGILSRLKKAFNVHSPSRETRDIFQNVMKGAELGLEDEQRNLNKQVEAITRQMKSDFSSMVPNMGAINKSIIDQTRTVFTTPTLNIYAQDELTPAKMNSIIDTVNRRLGSKY